MIKSEKTTYQSFFILIFWNRFIRYVKVGLFLHIVALLGIYIFLLSIQKLQYLKIDFTNINFCIWSYLFLFGISLAVLAELDVRGRYQNYKQLKDKLFSLGYDDRLIKPFTHSKCQRLAILEAAKDLNYVKEMKNSFYKFGYRWYHILPDSFMKNPKVLFKKQFWTKIFFVKYYKLQNFYW